MKIYSLGSKPHSVPLGINKILQKNCRNMNADTKYFVLVVAYQLLK